MVWRSFFTSGARTLSWPGPQDRLLAFQLQVGQLQASGFDLGMNFIEWHGPVPLAPEMGVFDRALKFLLN